MEIELKIKRGNHLPVMDIYSSDPYIIFEHNKKKYKTKKISNTIHPEWNEKFKLKVEKNEQITFYCWDYDRIGKDDHMGDYIWNVPELINEEKDYFILRSNRRGEIIISVKCLSGGKEKQIQNDFNLNERTIIKIKMEKIEGIAMSLLLKDQILTPHIVGEFETSFGKYSCGLSPIRIDKYTTKSLNKSRIYYIETKAGETIQYFVYPANDKHVITDTSFGKCEFVIPDLHENENNKMTVQIKPHGQIVMEMKCKKSLYRNVNPSCIPSSNDLIEGPSFPCELIVQKVIGNKHSLDLHQNYSAFVKLKLNGINYRTGSLWQGNSGIHPKEWNQSFILPYYVGSLCKVKLRTTLSDTNQFKKLARGEFILDESLMNQPDISIEVELNENYGKLLIKIKRIRELSKDFMIKYNQFMYTLMYDNSNQLQNEN